MILLNDTDITPYDHVHGSKHDHPFVETADVMDIAAVLDDVEPGDEICIETTRWEYARVKVTDTGSNTLDGETPDGLSVHVSVGEAKHERGSYHEITAISVLE